MSEEETGLAEGSCLPPSLSRGRLTQQGISIVRKEPTKDLTMARGGREEVRFRKAAKQAVTRKRKQLEQAVNSNVNDSDIEDAKDEFFVAFSKLEKSLDKVVSANGFDSDDSVDNAYMDEPTQDKMTVLAVYKKWSDKRKADEKIAEEIYNG